MEHRICRKPNECTITQNNFHQCWAPMLHEQQDREHTGVTIVWNNFQLFSHWTQMEKSTTYWQAILISHHNGNIWLFHPCIPITIRLQASASASASLPLLEQNELIIMWLVQSSTFFCINYIDFQYGGLMLKRKCGKLTRVGGMICWDKCQCFVNCLCRQAKSPPYNHSPRSPKMWVSN